MSENPDKRIKELEEQIADLKARLPRHSIPASMLIELEDMEEELEQLKTRNQPNAPDDHHPRPT